MTRLSLSPTCTSGLRQSSLGLRSRTACRITPKALLASARLTCCHSSPEVVRFRSGLYWCDRSAQQGNGVPRVQSDLQAALTAIDKNEVVLRHLGIDHDM